MQTVNDIIGKTQSATESARVALNATQETYAYLEAERKGGLSDLFNQAIDNLVRTGVGAQEALNTVAIRGQYLKDMSRGNKMFYTAATDLKQNVQLGAPDEKPLA